MIRSFNNIFYRHFSLATKYNVNSKKSSPKPQADPKEMIFSKLEDSLGYNLIHVELNKKYEKPDSEEGTYELTVVAIDFEAMKNAKRVSLVQKILKDEIKKLGNCTYRLLTPSKWYDSNQRGLKLKEIYGDPPLGDVERMAKEFYESRKIQKTEIPKLAANEEQASQTEIPKLAANQEKASQTQN